MFTDPNVTAAASPAIWAKCASLDELIDAMHGHYWQGTFARDEAEIKMGTIEAMGGKAGYLVLESGDDVRILANVPIKGAQHLRPSAGEPAARAMEKLGAICGGAWKD
jgi:hypothetical protein